mmetsp:Transcript_9939/g.30642  ORF Transcript_9939/g.30642 Transcript_9939/m.30642 type:complete len:225 (+) Transcript_9939:540-1214(+)
MAPPRARQLRGSKRIWLREPLRFLATPTMSMMFPRRPPEHRSPRSTSPLPTSQPAPSIWEPLRTQTTIFVTTRQPRQLLMKPRPAKHLMAPSRRRRDVSTCVLSPRTSRKRRRQRGCGSPPAGPGGDSTSSPPRLLKCSRRGRGNPRQRVSLQTRHPSNHGTPPPSQDRAPSCGGCAKWQRAHQNISVHWVTPCPWPWSSLQNRNDCFMPSPTHSPQQSPCHAA